MGKTFFVADFYHAVLGGVLHKLVKAVVYCANEEGWIFVSKTAARGNVSVGVNIENVAGALTVVFAEPFAVFPGARVFGREGTGKMVDWGRCGELPAGRGSGRLLAGWSEGKAFPTFIYGLNVYSIFAKNLLNGADKSLHAVCALSVVGIPAEADFAVVAGIVDFLEGSA